MRSIEDRVTPDTLAERRDTGVGLIGDIGATNARFALVFPGGKTTMARVYALDDFASLADALAAYLAEQSPATRPAEAVLAVASPVTGDEITLTNRAWTFSVEQLRRHLGLKRLQVINDFAANAAAIPFLDDDDRVQVGHGIAVEGAPVGSSDPVPGSASAAWLRRVAAS
jgi:glucokinase